MRSLSYCRVSTLKQAEDDKTSLDVQARANAAKLRALGCADDDIDTLDDADSGTKWEDRKELGPALKKIESGYYEYVCVYNVDRAVRTWEFIALLLLSCKRGGAKLVFATRDYDEGTFGELMLVIDAFRAQWGREDIVKNMNRGRRGRIESGKIHRFGPELYGYRRNKELGVRVAHQIEAAVVERIFNLKAEGYGYYQIAKLLNTDAIPSPGQSKNFQRRNASGCWMPTTVSDLIKNPAYKGEGVAWTRKSNGRGKTIRTDEAEHINVSADVTPAIVAPELWRRANDAAKDNRGDRTRNNNRPILLRGLIRCDVCKYRMYHDVYGTYRCRQTNEVSGRPAKCLGHPVKAITIENAVWQKMAEYLRKPEQLQEAIESAQEKGESVSDISSRLAIARTRLSENERQQRILLDQLMASSDPSWLRLIEQKKTELARQRKTVTEEIARLSQLRDQFDQLSSRARSLVEQCRQFKDALEEFEFKHKRKTLEAFGVQVFASGEVWEIKIYPR